jgi:hypothetical protein
MLCSSETQRRQLSAVTLPFNLHEMNDEVICSGAASRLLSFEFIPMLPMKAVVVGVVLCTAGMIWIYCNILF